jgi:hypothetical protein
MQQSTLFPIFRRGNARLRQSPATTVTGRNESSISTAVDGGSGTTARADRPPAAHASVSGDATASTSSLSAAVARASTRASAGAGATVLGQTPAALPATTSPDAEAQQSRLPSMAVRLETGALAGKTRTTPQASHPPEGSGTTARVDCPLAARNASESGDAAATTSSLSAAVTHASTSASTSTRGTVLGQNPAALPATTSPDAEARQSGLPAMAVHLGTSALAGEMRMTLRVSHPPAALAAPPVNAVCDALVIETAGGDVEGVAQRALTSLPLRAVDQTTQMAATAPVARAVAAACTDGCVGGTCGEMHG